jgi:predicted HTH transcriptional regulator
MNDIQNKIIEYIINDKYITQNSIAEKINVNVRTIKRNFKVLIDNNIIERVGSDKSGYWEVL